MGKAILSLAEPALVSKPVLRKVWVGLAHVMQNDVSGDFKTVTLIASRRGNRIYVAVTATNASTKSPTFIVDEDRIYVRRGCKIVLAHQQKSDDGRKEFVLAPSGQKFVLALGASLG